MTEKEDPEPSPPPPPPPPPPAAPPSSSSLPPPPRLSPQLFSDPKWDACSDVILRRFCYFSLAGAAAALLVFRTPPTRWAAVAFGTGLGLGSAYTDCLHIMDVRSSRSPHPPDLPVAEVPSQE